MASSVSRRDFIKYAGGGIAALVVGSKMNWILRDPNYASAAVQTIKFEIGDAIKEMVTHNPSSLDVPGQLTNPALINNDARCYFWVYKHQTPLPGFPTGFPAEVPGPDIFAAQGDIINMEVKNSLDEDHAFFIPGLVNSGPIAPGATWTASFTASLTGTHMYFDNLNAPVNRVMGLHGALHVHPSAPVPGHKLTPYSDPTPGVQKLFDDFGDSAHLAGLAWDEGDDNPASFAPAMRMYVWLDHQAAPNLFAAVGDPQWTNVHTGPLSPRNPVNFIEKFLRSPFDPTNSAAFMGAQYFTIDGQSGHFSHNNPRICPNLRVGEPCVIHILNAGLWSHSMHVHANHVYITYVNGVVQENPLWVDTFSILPGTRVDYVVPYHRPPDVPNRRGIGLATPDDAPLISLVNPLIPGSTVHPVWPPTEELAMILPPTPASEAVQLSPICYPMHDHSEPSQSSQGGNYNLGLISGINFTGDRNINPAAVTTFPHAPPPSEFPSNTTAPAAPPVVP
jgi:hypothetical protein